MNPLSCTALLLGASVVLSSSSSSLLAGDPILIDHSCTVIRRVPLAWVKKAKKDLHIAYGHTSHGSQLTSGMSGLVKFTKGGGVALFAWNRGGKGGALDLHDYAMKGDVGYYPQWVNETKKYLGDAKNAQVNVILWSWCGQLSGYTKQQMIDRYLTPMAKLEKSYPKVRFVYMTGHLNIWWHANTKARNDQVRAFCKLGGRVLYDFADIESWDPDGTHYPYADDACNYYDAKKKKLGNWAINWQNSHKKDVEWYACSSAHSQPLNANRKAFAAWWLWARLAGWKGMAALKPDGKSIPVKTGGKIRFQLDAGSAEARRVYLMLGSASGTRSNLVLPGEFSVLPLQFDAFSVLTLTALNSQAFGSFLGTLDSLGSAQATLSLPALPSSAAGQTLHFSYLLFSPSFDLSSQPVAVRLLP